MKTKILEYKKTLIFGCVICCVLMVWSFLPTKKQEGIISSPQVQASIQILKHTSPVKQIVNTRNEVVHNQPTQTQRIPGEAFIYAEIIDDVTGIDTSHFFPFVVEVAKAAKVDLAPMKNLQIGDTFFLNFDGKIFGGTITDLENEGNLFIFQFYDQDKEIPDGYNKSRVSVIFKPEGGLESANFDILQYYGPSYTGWVNDKGILMMGTSYEINQADIRMNGDEIDRESDMVGSFKDPNMQQNLEYVNE